MSKDVRVTEDKIRKYLACGFFERKPRLTTPEVVAYAQSIGADWTVMNWSETKHTKAEGMRYFTGGGSRDYNGYAVYSGRNRIFTSTETYRTIGDLLRMLPNYRKLAGRED